MTKPSQRTTLLGWMTSILLIALGSSAWLYQGRRLAYLHLAGHHRAEMERYERQSRERGAFAAFFEGRERNRLVIPSLNPYPDTLSLLVEQAAFNRKAEHEAALSHKYREAAARPWLVVEPDPPSP